MEEGQSPLKISDVAPLGGDGLVDAFLPHALLFADGANDRLDARLVYPQGRLDVVQLLPILSVQCGLLRATLKVWHGIHAGA